LKRDDKAVVLRLLERVSGYSRQQLNPVAQWLPKPAEAVISPRRKRGVVRKGVFA
jgi:hypothetical protein